MGRLPRDYYSLLRVVPLPLLQYYYLLRVVVLLQMCALSAEINVLGSVGLATPLKCDICVADEDEATVEQIDHYTNITVYKQDGDVILGGLFPLQELDKERGAIRYKNVALVEIMAWTVDRINEDPNILPNITLGYEIRDSFGNAPFASVQALELAAKNVFGVVGPGSSKVAVHIASLLGSLSFPMITYAATSDLLSDSKRFRMFARTVPSDEFQCRAIADLIKFYNWSFVTIIHSPELYGTEGANELRKILAEERVYVDKFHSLPETTTPEYLTDMLEQTFQQNATNQNQYPASVIVLFATTSYAKQVVEAAASMNRMATHRHMFIDKTWIASESWGSNSQILKTFNSSNIGYFIGLKIKSFPVKEFAEYFRNLTPDNTSNPWFRHYYKHLFCGGDVQNCIHNVYDQGQFEEPVLLAVEAFAHTLHKMLSSRDPAQAIDPCILAATPISNSSDLFYLRNSAVGKCLFSELITGAVPVHMVEILKSVKDTYRTRTRELVRFDNTTGDFEAMYSYLTLLEFRLSSNHDHDHTDAIVDALHDIGIWNKTGIFLDDALVPFGGLEPPPSICSNDCLPGTMKIDGQIARCWSCVPCDHQSISNATNSDVCYSCLEGFKTINNRTECQRIPPTYLSADHPAAIILIIISIIGVGMTIFTITVFIKFRETPLVKASSKELCMVLLIGIFIGFIASLFSIGLPSNQVCLMQLVSGNLFGTLTIIPIFLKTARVYALFFQTQKSAGRPPRYLLPVWQSMLCMLLIFVQMVILMFIIIWYPLKRQEEYPNAETVLVVCEGLTSHDTVIALALPVGYVMCFMALSTIISYQVRKLPSNFQEAKYICFSLIIALIVIIAFVPSYFVTVGIWQKFCLGIAMQIIALSLLILIFLKKVEIIVFYPERNKIVFEKDKISKLDLTRKERRKSFLVSQNCHMCGHFLVPENHTKIGLISAANLLGVNHQEDVSDLEVTVKCTETDLGYSIPESGESDESSQ